MRIIYWSKYPVPTDRLFRIGYYIGEIVLRIGKLTVVKDCYKGDAKKMHFKLLVIN